MQQTLLKYTLIALMAFPIMATASTIQTVANPLKKAEIAVFTDSPVFKLYPNPSDGKVIGLRLENVLNQQGVVTIYNSIGSRVAQVVVPAKGTKREINVPLDHELIPGLYLLTFSIGDKHHTERLVVK